MIEKNRIKSIDKIGWPRCEICGQPVFPREGVLYILKRDVLHAGQEHREHDARLPDKASLDVSSFSWEEYRASVPFTAHWHWGHSRCADLGTAMYSIEASILYNIEASVAQ